MRLLNYGAGEITDRLTILSLKILHGGAEERTKHFRDERAALLTKLRGRESVGGWLDQALMLGAVNGALWQAEDELRDWRARWGAASLGESYIASTAREAALVAFRIQELNDQRAALLQQINALTGETAGPEKLT
jgi:hypothetical protein